MPLGGAAVQRLVGHGPCENSRASSCRVDGLPCYPSGIVSTKPSNESSRILWLSPPALRLPRKRQFVKVCVCISGIRRSWVHGVNRNPPCSQMGRETERELVEGSFGRNVGQLSRHGIAMLARRQQYDAAPPGGHHAGQQTL
jgi:hypothetical protein